MRAAVVPEPGRLELVSIPEPTYGDYEALVEVLTCSICSGTDTHIVYDQFPWRAYPIISLSALVRFIRWFETASPTAA